MRTIKSFLYLFLIFSFVFQSCSIEKRRYTNGYSLQWKKNKSAVKNDETNEALTKVKQEPLTFKTVNALAASVEKKKGIIVFAPDSSGCDTLIMRNEVEIKAKIIEITPTEIRYKYCDNINGPTYVSYRYEVSYIKYASGRLDSFKDEYAPIKSAQNNNQNNSNYQNNSRNNNYNNNQNNTSYPTYSQPNNYNNNNYNANNWIEGRANKLSLLSLIFGFVSLVPFFGIPGIFIGMSSGFKALRLIKQNQRELGIYKQRALIGIALTALVLLIYIGLFAYQLIQSGILRFII